MLSQRRSTFQPFIPGPTNDVSVRAASLLPSTDKE
jgi:hypothetical protein